MPKGKSQNSDPQHPPRQEIISVSQPGTSDTSPAPTSLMPAKPHKKYLIQILVAIYLLLVVGSIFAFYNFGHSDKANSESISSLSQKSHDLKTEQDLATLDTAIQNYNGGQDCKTLPSSLVKLNLSPDKLNYNLANYQYTNQGADCGGPGDYGFQLCATFQSNTFSQTAYNNYENNIPSGGSPAAYSIHDQGKQCYTDGGGAYGPTFEIILSNQETHLDNETNASNINLDLIASTIQTDYSKQATLLGIHNSPSDVIKQCALSSDTTFSNQKLYYCRIDINTKSINTTLSLNTLYSLINQFETLSTREGYSGGIEENYLNTNGEFKGNDCLTPDSVTNVIDCEYDATTSNCNLEAYYGNALNPPYETVTFRLNCDNFPLVAEIPTSFKQVSPDTINDYGSSTTSTGSNTTQ